MSVLARVATPVEARDFVTGDLQIIFRDSVVLSQRVHLGLTSPALLCRSYGISEDNNGNSLIDLSVHRRAGPVRAPPTASGVANPQSGLGARRTFLFTNSWMPSGP